MSHTKSEFSERTLRPAAGILIPATLLLLMAVDAYHFLYPRAFVDSPFLRATLGAKADAPFAANLTVKSDVVQGDLVGKLAPSEAIGPIVFSTDAWGYRSTPGGSAETARVLVAMGHSFLYGSALSDDAALPAQYARLTSVPAYNGGRYADDEDGLPELELLLSHLPQVRRVYLLVLERWDGVSPREAAHGVPYRVWRRVGFTESAWIHWIRRPYREVARQLGRRIETSLVRHMGRRLQTLLERQSVLPAGPTISSVHYLRNGARMLTRQEEDARLLVPPTESQVESTAFSVSEFCDALTAAKYEVSVVLIPDKLTVYAPILRDRFPGTRYAGAHIERVEAALRRRGLDVINPLPELQRAATVEMSGGCRIYYMDDTHWTSCGTEVVARVMAQRDTAIAKGTR
jgi:hypothetical protein